MANVWSNWFAKIRELFQNKNAYDPIVMNDLIQVTNRTMLMATINHMMENGLPFKLKGYSISHYRLPSSGPHPAVHFLWNRSINDTLDCPEQLKLIHELKNESKTYYSKAMKTEIQNKILKLGIVKTCQANFLIKDLLGDQSAASDDSQSNIFHRLNIAIKSGKNIVVDLHHNNGHQPKSEEFWQVKVILRYF